MKTIFICFLGLIGALQNLTAQSFGTLVAPEYVHVNAYSSTGADCFSISSNQASLASLKQFSAGIYTERKYMLEELGSYMAAAAICSGSGNFGLAGSYSGNSSYNTSGVGLAYARKIGKLDAGVQFNYYSLHIATYGNASVPIIEGGIIYHFSDQFQAGIHLNQFARSAQEELVQALPVIYSLGIGYNSFNNFFIGSELEKENNGPVRMNVGMEYKFDQQLFARIGVSSSTATFYLGASVLFHKIRLDVTASVHPELGITPGLLLEYRLSNQE